jgi:hypothetical protein
VSTIFLLQSGSNTDVSTPRRSTPRKVASAGSTAYHVLFTGFSDTKQESIVRKLGMKVHKAGNGVKDTETVT